MIYFNSQLNKYYTPGSSITIKTSTGVFSGIPTESQLLSWGFTEYVEQTGVNQTVPNNDSYDQSQLYNE